MDKFLSFKNCVVVDKKSSYLFSVVRLNVLFNESMNEKNFIVPSSVNIQITS